MIQAESRIRIAQPATTVFRFVVDDFFDNYPRWSPEVVELEALDSHRLEPGHRARQVRVDHGRRSETVVRVTRLDAPHFIEFESEDSPSFRIRFDFTPTDTHSTEFTFQFELLRVEFYMRPFAKLIRRALHDGTARSVDRLQDLLEQDP